jgi:hypothetical protein
MSKSGVRRHRWPLRAYEDGGAYELIVVTDAATREAALGFAHEVYVARGLADRQSGASLLPCAAADEAVVLLVLGRGERPVATLWVLPDGPRGLPCDATYGAEVAEIRGRGRRLVQFILLAANVGDPVPWLAVRELVAFGWVVAQDVLGGTDAVIEVNPRHAGYYEQSAGFVVVGPERPCSRVRGAPAVLLRAPLAAAAVRGPMAGSWVARENPRIFFDEHERRVAAAYARRAVSPQERVRSVGSRRPTRYRPL